MFSYGYGKLGVGGLTRHSGYFPGYEVDSVEDRMQESGVRTRHLFVFIFTIT